MTQLLVAALLLAAASCGHARPVAETGQPNGVVEARWLTPAARIDSLLAEAPAGLDVAGYAEWFGKRLEGTPYVAGTLEVVPEMPTVSLDGLDCTTFVETVAALALTAAEGRHTAADFLWNLRGLRYRGGRDPKGRYAARLHYMSDWALDNISRGNVADVTPALKGAEYVTKSLDFMSAHRDAYPALAAEDEALAEVRRVEGGYRNHRYPQLPTARLGREAAAGLRSGDIVVFLTKTPGLDASHVGFVTVAPDGTVGLRHASSAKGRVLTDPLPLESYLRRQKSVTGIRVLRLVQP